MDWIDWGDAAGWAAVGVAVLAAVVAVVAAKRAHGSAVRSAAAAERSADADQRMAALAEAEAARYEPPWEIIPGGNMRRVLQNNGDEDALDVSIEGDSLLVTGPAQNQWDRIGTGESVEFFAARTIDQTDDMATIRWLEPGGTRRELRRALP